MTWCARCRVSDTAAPSAEGSGFVSRGAKNVGAHIMGVNAEDELAIPSFRSRIVEGDFAAVDQQNAAVGIKMADDMGLATRQPHPSDLGRGRDADISSGGALRPRNGERQ